MPLRIEQVAAFMKNETELLPLHTDTLPQG